MRSIKKGWLIAGGTFLVWFGPTARLTISDPVLIREVLNQKSDLFEKTDPPPHVRKLEGDGLLTLKGEKWVHHRKIIAPAFYQQNLKVSSIKIIPRYKIWIISNNYYLVSFFVFVFGNTPKTPLVYCMTGKKEVAEVLHAHL